MSMSNVNQNANLQAASEKFAENLAKYPIEEQLAVGAISKNVLNGCSWEFVRQTSDYRKHLEEFKANPNVSVQEVVYNHQAKTKVTGYLVYMNLSYLCNLLNKEAPGLINQKDLELASKHREEAVESLYKKMKDRTFKGRIGIYCTNDSQSITVSGKTYPAYAVSLREMLQVAERCGYGVEVAGAVRRPSDVLAREDAVLKAMTVAPSSNAMFIDIAPLN